MVLRSLLFFAVSLLLISCNQKSEEINTSLIKVRDPKERLAEWWTKVYEAKKKFNNGDLITRAGSDVISASLQNFNKQDKTYSHSGLAFLESGEIYVYHTIAGDNNPGDRMIREPFDSFCNPEKKSGLGIFRYDINNQEIDSLHSYIKDHFKNGMAFDKLFDLKDDSTMYCAEIITKGLKRSTNNRVIIPTTVVKNLRVKDPAFRGKVFKIFEYIAVDNLYMNSHCKEIARVQFN